MKTISQEFAVKNQEIFSISQEIKMISLYRTARKGREVVLHQGFG
jgi:hypothetical protein